MTKKVASQATRFCPSCGEATLPKAKFCAACGSSLASASGATQVRSQLPALGVLGAFLAIGLGLWVAVLAPKGDAGRLPLAPKQATTSAPAAGSAGADTASMPPDHPPLSVPEEVKTRLVDLEKRANEAPKDLGAWQNAAALQYRVGQLDREYLAKAKTSYEHVLELDPKNLDALRGLGNIHFDRDEYGPATARYAEYLAIKPDDVNVRTDLGTMHLYDQKPAAAIVEYERVLASAPDFYQAHFNLALAYRSTGKPELSLASFEKAKSFAPDDRTKQQIDAAMSAAGSPPSDVEAQDQGGVLTPFQQRVEKDLRANPIAGPKVAGVEWTTPTDARVRLTKFPMENMPPAIRTKYLDRLKSELEAAKRESGVAEKASLELVDAETGRSMARVE